MPRQETSHVIGLLSHDSQDVMDVEKTVSPQMLVGAPKERPTNDCPVFKWSVAGKEADVEGAWVAKPRERRAIRVRLRANILSRVVFND